MIKKLIRRFLLIIKYCPYIPFLNVVHLRSWCYRFVLKSMGRNTYILDGVTIIAPEKLKEGDSVLIENYGTTGVLLEDPAGKKKVRVGLGNIETVIETIRLKGSLKKKRSKNKVPRQINLNVQAESTSKVKTTCDLRGMNSEQALITMENFLSQAIVSNIRQATIIHGHGMGTIKSLVRDYLSSTGLCKDFSPAPRENGGDGATIIKF